MLVRSLRGTVSSHPCCRALNQNNSGVLWSVRRKSSEFWLLPVLSADSPVPSDKSM